MRFPAYPQYKASGVEGLGDVPEHWEVKRSDTFVATERTQVDPAGFSGVDVIHYSIPAVQETGSGLVEEGESIASAKQVISSRALLVSKLNPRKATICIAEPGSLLTLCSTEFVVLKVRRGSLRFLRYLASSELFRQRLAAAVQSVTRSHQRAAPELIHRFWAAWPDASEQGAIVGFLESQTAKIDGLIARKRVLITKLKEKRDALIWRTVTSGLPAEDAETTSPPSDRPCGFEWIDDVPQHWRIVPLGYVARFRGGATPDKSEPEYWDGVIPWVSPKDMKRARLFDALDHVSQDALDETALAIIDPGAVLIVVRGMILAHSFPVATAEVPVTINQDMKALIADQAMDPRFLAWVLTGSARALVMLADESAHGTRKLETAVLAKYPVAVPPLDDQRAIVTYLDQETEKLDRLAAKVETAIDRLREYRAALITAAVTGQIDVRGAVP